ncbi:response regulator, partial [Chromobacterium haemolyticum]|uniref:response regulator n=1 Tax=Chromobacterium haemolyticum TaxID=394935 RepID=UPI00307F941B
GGGGCDVILLDCHLPDMDGYEVARRIRAWEKTRQYAPVPIIAISAATSDEHQLRCAESGMDGILSKPLTMDGLAGVLSLWLDMESGSIDLPDWGVEEPLADLYELYEKSVHADLALLESAVGKADHAQILHILHRLKGGALTVGVATLSQLASEEETRQKHIDLFDAQSLTAWGCRFREEFHRWIQYRNG